jgi:hypothetical protein
MFTIVMTAVGLALIGLALHDIFHQLFHPQGGGSISRLVAGAVWRAFRRLARWRPRVLDVAGPSIIVSVIATWTLLLWLGWTCVYWPRMPGQFRFAAGLSAAPDWPFMDALYLSLTTLATIGYGDITPLTPAMRLAGVLEGTLGFGLLSASISWVLSLYPVLQRRRATAMHVSLLCDMGAGGVRRADAARDLAARLIELRTDLLQFPKSYYFHDGGTRESLPRALLRLERRSRAPGEAQDEAFVLLDHALGELRGELRRHPALRRHGTSDEDVLAAYAADHGVAP